MNFTASTLSGPGIKGAANGLRGRLREFCSFGLVGSIGFIVDGGLLTILVEEWGCGPISGRAVSFPAAVLVTWLLNRSFTFRRLTRHADTTLREYARYFAVQIVGALVNVVVYSALVLIWPIFARMPLVPLAMAATLALIVNYLGSRGLVFSRGPARDAVAVARERT